MKCMNCIYRADINDNAINSIAEPLCSGIENEQERLACIENMKTLIRNTVTELRMRYKLIIYCKAKNTIVVSNPDKPTQTVKQCSLYKEKTQ